MIIGIPTEVKVHEYRVGMVPWGVRQLVEHGHQVVVQQGAGLGSGIKDEAYQQAGARILSSADEVWGVADMIIKVKEPLPVEYPRMRENQIVYTYFHLAPVPELTTAVLERKIIGVAYETIAPPGGGLPCLKPMSEVAGRMAIQVAARSLEKEHGGKGLLLGGVPGVRRASVTIIGGGVVGTNAAKIALGMGASVTLLDVDLGRLEYLDHIFQGAVQTVFSNPVSIEENVVQADVVVGAVLIPGAKAPHLVTRELLRRMEPGSVVVDVAVDQGGCIETCRPTTHEHPTFVEEGVVHYCVANMPGAVAHTSTLALTNTTLPYGIQIADLGVEGAARRSPAIFSGVNVYKGTLVYEAVATSQGRTWEPLTL
ncbi:MAG: alanine dehydrogenase [Myxococcota bacterium]|jgi:alanine dehydrogenase|nr:alanine dehydrogenase [Myxococcota bacterium]